MDIDLWVLISGSLRVEGDEEEDDTDDIEHEFNYRALVPRGSGPVPSVYGGSGLSGSYENVSFSRQDSSMELPLLTYREEVNIPVSP